MTKQKAKTIYFRLTSDEVRDNCIKTMYLAHQDSEEVLEVVIQPEQRKRSLAQNRLYWLWMKHIADHVGDVDSGIHYDFKRRFLLKIYYRDSNSFAAMCDSIKALQDLDLQHYDMIAKEVVSLVSTTKATDKQMSEYLDDIYRFCYAQGLFLLIPEDLAWVRD